MDKSARVLFLKLHAAAMKMVVFIIICPVWVTLMVMIISKYASEGDPVPSLPNLGCSGPRPWRLDWLACITLRDIAVNRASNPHDR